MKLIVDNNIDHRILRSLADLDVQHVQHLGLGHYKDGPLLEALAGRFNVLLTVDRNLPFQQNLSRYDISVLILRARSNRLTDLLPLLPALRRKLPECRPGEWYEVS